VQSTTFVGVVDYLNLPAAPTAGAEGFLAKEGIFLREDQPLRCTVAIALGYCWLVTGFSSGQFGFSTRACTGQ
jgi:hypothetical protein